MDSQITPKLSPQDLAKAWNVPLTKIYSLTRQAKTNGFPVLKIGKYIRLDLEECNQWLKEQQQK